ncbi:hypothetical protein GR255_25685, partial [Mycobacterium tuberculosis]|nr:hypothetical protein [Mycobacterium tuberculosis]
MGRQGWYRMVTLLPQTLGWTNTLTKSLSVKNSGETVWFGSDVGQLSNRKAGILATDVYDFESSM